MPDGSDVPEAVFVVAAAGYGDVVFVCPYVYMSLNFFSKVDVK